LTKMSPRVLYAVRAGAGADPSRRSKYPDVANKAELEGTVWVRIWVDKQGKARKAVVMKSDADVFNQPAIDAAMHGFFLPQ